MGHPLTGRWCGNNPDIMGTAFQTIWDRNGFVRYNSKKPTELEFACDSDDEAQIRADLKAINETPEGAAKAPDAPVAQ